MTVLKCNADDLINLDVPVSNYLPWFFTMYKGEKQKITIRQLPHQTTGIPFRLVTRISLSTASNTLELKSHPEKTEPWEFNWRNVENPYQ